MTQLILISSEELEIWNVASKFGTINSKLEK